MKVGDNLREIREKQTKFRQEDVAKALGISTKAYGNIENNQADITLKRLTELSEIFGVTPEYIISYQNKPTYTNVFNNYDGNQGLITIDQSQIKGRDLLYQLQRELIESQRKRIDLLEALLKANNIDF